MEFELLEVKDIGEIRKILTFANQEEHKNHKNYDIKAIEKRWKRYHVFHKLIDNTLGGVIAISGVYQYHDNLARVIDRTWIHPYYRSSYLNKNNNMIVRPVIDYFLPEQSRYCRERGIVSFISVQYPSKTRVLERLCRETNLGYEIQPDFYFTCHHDKLHSKTCWHRLISDGQVSLLRKTADQVNALFK